MSSNGGSTKYVLDTNILIDLALWYPVDLNTKFWNFLEESLTEKKWILLDEVVGEIKGDADLLKWCKRQKANNNVTELPNDARIRGIEINNIYEMIDQITQRSTVDTYLVAYAEKNNFIIFSRESPRKNTKELHKIPDVCKALGILYTREPRNFYKAINYKNIQ